MFLAGVPLFFRLIETLALKLPPSLVLELPLLLSDVLPLLLELPPSLALVSLPSPVLYKKLVEIFFHFFFKFIKV